jgi:hypothetical protein
MQSPSNSIVSERTGSWERRSAGQVPEHLPRSVWPPLTAITPRPRAPTAERTSAAMSAAAARAIVRASTRIAIFVATPTFPRIQAPPGRPVPHGLPAVGFCQPPGGDTA